MLGVRLQLRGGVSSLWVKWAGQGGGRKYFLFWTAGGGNNSEKYGTTIDKILDILQNADPKKAKDPTVAEVNRRPNITVVFADDLVDPTKKIYSRPPVAARSPS